MVVGLTHERGGTLDLLMTDVPDLVRVAVAAPIGNSDHSSLSTVISMAQVVPNLCVSRRVFLKHQIDLGLTGKSLSAIKLELMKPTRRPSVSLVTETGMFL